MVKKPEKSGRATFGGRPGVLLNRGSDARWSFPRHMAERTTLLLRPSRRKFGLLVLAAGVLVAGGVSMIASHDRLTTVVGWVAVIFFGLGGIVSVAQLFMKSYLLLTPEGFAVRGLGRQYMTAWSDVTGFSAIRPTSMYPVSKMIVYNFAPGYSRMPGVRRLGRAISGYEAGLPDTYGMRPEDLAALMNEWRARHAADSEHGPNHRPTPSA
jgi:hypothetical protein